MRELALAVSALLAFLVPVGSYCFILAIINRRARPLIVRGAWDTIGLLAAGSGFFLVTIPMLLTELQLRLTGEVGTLREFADAPLGQWLVWLVYVLFLASGAAWMFLWRLNKTMIYNVDTQHFDDAFKRALAGVGLAVRAKHKGHMTLAPPAPSAETGFTEEPVRVAEPAADGSRLAEVEVEVFPALCHVTLHWDTYTAEIRRQIEADLEKALELAAPEENPAAGWFLSISGLVFGALFTIGVVVLITVWRSL
jgi:hypothetical protein